MQLESTLRLNAICTCLTVLFLLGISEPAPIPPGRLIDIGGRPLHLNCTGNGSPVVVAESLCNRKSRNLRPDDRHKAVAAGFAAPSQTGKLVIAKHSEHEIHMYQPHLVIQSLRDIVEEARKKTTKRG